MKQGLSGISTPELESLYKELQRGTLRAPLSAAALRAAGLARLVSPLESLASLDAETICVLVDAVLQDRRSRVPPRVDLVWTGPETRGATTRDTAVVVAELFSGAKHEVILAGFSFDHGEDIFAPLHKQMIEQGVTVQIFLDIARLPTEYVHPQHHIDRHMKQFLQKNWPFAEPYPALFYDPRTIDPDSTTSLHAKCIVVDEQKSLVTSANFTQRGQSRNLEVGVLIDDVVFARDLAAQWRAVCRSGLLRQWVASDTPSPTA